MGVDEAAVRAAFKARKAHIAANLNTMTLKTCRETLEADLGVDKGTLKPFKKLLGALIDRILAKQQAAVEQPDSEAVATEPTVSAKKQPKSRQKAGSDEEDEDVADEQVKHSSKRQKQGEKQPAKTSGPRQYSKAVEKLRGVAKAATVTIPPTLYVKNKSDEQLQAALEALLEKHDLDAHSGQSDIQRARARLQTQRDLDGIDTSNIIQGGRGRRSAAPTSFKPAAQPASGSDSEGEVEESDSEGSEGEQAPEAGSDSGADSGDSQPAKPRKTALRDSKQQQHSQQKRSLKPAATADSESAEASSEDESDEAASEEECAGVGAAAAAAKAQSGRSPNDENEAAKSNDGGGMRAASKGQLAVGLEDSDDEGLAAPAAKRRGLTEWSEDDDRGRHRDLH